MSNPASSDEPKKATRYSELILSIFRKHYADGVTEFEFERSELEGAATRAKIKLPSNLGDVIYSLRFRTAMPDEIAKTAPKGREWVIDSLRNKAEIELNSIEWRNLRHTMSI